MNTAQQLIDQLGLQPHPEGGWYKEIYRSPVQVEFNGKSRAAMTEIYFLLEENKVSRWHVVDADETWHFYEGSSLELLVAPPDFSRIEIINLGEVGDGKGQRPVHVVPAGWWQAAAAKGPYTLVGCTVAPGFEFAGFRFLEESEKEKMRSIKSGMERFL